MTKIGRKPISAGSIVAWDGGGEEIVSLFQSAHRNTPGSAGKCTGVRRHRTTGLFLILPLESRSIYDNPSVLDAHETRAIGPEVQGTPLS